MNTKQSRQQGRLDWKGSKGASRLALAALGLAALTGCQESQQTLTIGDLASSYNREMWNLSLWAIAASIVIFVGVSAALFYTVFRFREDNNKEEPQQFHGNEKLEVFLVGIPVVIVMVLSILSVRTMANTNPVDKSSTDRVEALAMQFWWNFAYPNIKSPEGAAVTNGNEMVVPTGRPTTVVLNSRDVVHEFWAPNLGPQRQAIPGSEKIWNIDTDRPGVYQGNCNYLCGASHANMRFKVIALPDAEYKAFADAAANYAAPTPTPGSAEARGYELFMKGKPETGALACAACHRVQGTPAAGAAGPDLSFFGTRRTLGAGMWEGEKAQEMLIPWIKHSPQVKPGSIMPTYDGSTYLVNGKETKGGLLTDAEIGDVAAYLRTLKLPESGDYWQSVDHFNQPTILPGGVQ
ncbi:cytochrome c oxidase subunit II [Deinococcus lacus]|uniref:Cytochrome c oxidase subunit 2 n=1 Tax=Deinococcus lacus TaxID=392561 RepID=A0ABW1YDN7_9DEIO